MAQKKNYYVVRKGRKPGIYPLWEGSQGAKAQVDGFTGAQFRGFATLPEAEAYLAGKELAPAASSYPPPLLIGTETQADLTVPEVDPDTIVIFTDGACSGNPGPGGYGAIVRMDGKEMELSGGFGCTTNNRMEMMACIMALQSIKQPSKVSLYSDSSYVVNAVQKGWAKRWKANAWVRTQTKAGEKQMAENSDLWQKMLDVLVIHQVTFFWVRGHAHHPENERCDRLAVAASLQMGLPTDPGFTRRC